jgi:septal ring factor EnvC (AmiA/AmiB activator)
MKTAIKLTILMLLIGTGSFAQSKKDLEVKISKQQKTIDSLNAVIANMENIIENRDRSIKIYAADEEKYVKSLSDFNIALDNCRNQKATLQSQNAYGVAKIMPMNNSRSTLKVKAGPYHYYKSVYGRLHFQHYNRFYRQCCFGRDSCIHQRN